MKKMICGWKELSVSYMIFAALSSVLAIVAAIVFQVSYHGTQYYELLAVILPLIGVAAFLLLNFVRPVRPFAGIVLWLFLFVSFLVYVHAVYMYLSEVFYSGITAEAISSISPAFIGTMVLYLGAAIVANVTAWLRKTKKVTE